MKIAHNQNNNYSRVKLQKPTGKVSMFFRHPLVLFGIVLSLMMASLVSGVYLYKSGVLTRIKASIMESRFVAQENIQKELSPYVDNGLPKLYLDIAFNDYQQLSQKRDEALHTGILIATDDDYVPGAIHLENQSSQEIDLRLKGDWTDHLTGDKWSFRIHMKGEGQLFGMRTFSIQAPETREYLDEWAYHQYLLQQGIMTTHYQFVNVIINGEPKGIYALEESFAEELIESEERRQGVLLRFNEDNMWENTVNFWENGINIQNGFWVTDLSTAQVSLFREGTILRDEVLSKEAYTAIALLQGFQQDTLSADEVFDVKLLGKFYATSDLWGAMHGTAWHNMRFYYNPVTGLLEPVLYDGEALRPQDDQNTLAFAFADSKLFSDPSVRIAYANALQEIIKAENLDSFIQSTAKEFKQLQTALKQEYIRDADQELLESPWVSLKRRAEMLRIQLQPEAPMWGAIRPVWLENSERAGSYMEIELQTQYLIPLNLLSISINGLEYPLETVMVDARTKAEFNDDMRIYPQLLPIKNKNLTTFPNGRLYLPFDLSNYDSLSSEPMIFVQIAGTDFTRMISLSTLEMVDQPLSEFKPKIPELAEVLAAHPFLLLDENEKQTLKVLPGEWAINRDLILPDGYRLSAGPGTTLKFAETAILYSTGALQFSGTQDAPVVLKAKGDKWPGIVVIRADDESVLEHVIIADTNSIQRGGWILTGGVTFYESPVVLDKVTIDGTNAEDSINVIRTSFTFKDSRFLDTASDAFDSDFSDGIISGCQFVNVGGDAIDVSGSATQVTNTTFTNITDKSISVGEHSSVLVQDVDINGTGIGIASKDLSDATLLRVHISGAENAALAAYQKKSVFGPASIVGEEISISDCERPSIIQVGSTARINGSLLETVEQTYQDLFVQGLLGS